MTHVWPLYGLGLAVVVMRSWRAAIDLRVAALVLAADWLGSNLIRWVSADDYRGGYQPMDLALAIAFFIAWLTVQKPWMAVIATLYLISGIILATYENISGSKYSYDLALNAAFLARLAVIWISSTEPRKAQETA